MVYKKIDGRKQVVIRYNNAYYPYTIKGNIEHIRKGDKLDIKYLGLLEVTRATKNIVQARMVNPSMFWTWR